MAPTVYLSGGTAAMVGLFCGALLLNLVGLWILAIAGRPEWPARIMVWICLGVLGIVGLHQDGMIAAWSPWWAVIPIVSAYTLGRIETAVWTSVALAVAVAVPFLAGTLAGRAFAGVPQMVLVVAQLIAVVVVAVLAVLYTILRNRSRALEQEHRDTRRALEATTERVQGLAQKAGQAETTDGVLHNIKNVLNSVGVAGRHLEEHVEQVRLDRLDRAVALLEEQPDLATFFQGDPRAEQVVGYLRGVSDHLADQLGVLGRSSRVLVTTVGELRDLVSTQQTLARAGGTVEHCDPREVVTAAVDLHATALVGEAVELQTAFAPEVPKALLDRGMLLQILQNLLANAGDAVAETEREGRICVEMTREADELKLAVSDNGVGLTPELQEQLFSRGFTTKEDGHGFGLVTSRDLARAMGGDLVGHSEGPGQGATFTLMLPLERPPAADEERYLGRSPGSTSRNRGGRRSIASSSG